ncbi:conserved hypothetical protein [Trichinella spiralis]|uniref:hypothetical protein n=1 Tax=Trichinella spiralis TaxID=6334 RepID=UPI0001EFE07C|nr:conserved hypothetical protein [Trichinella spiralis]
MNNKNVRNITIVCELISVSSGTEHMTNYDDFACKIKKKEKTVKPKDEMKPYDQETSCCFRLCKNIFSTV